MEAVPKGDPDWIRTNDPQLRRLVLDPAELPGLVAQNFIRSHTYDLQLMTYD